MNAEFYTIPNRTQTHVSIGKKPVQKVSRCLQRPFDSKRGPKSRFPRFLSDARSEKRSKACYEKAPEGVLSESGTLLRPVEHILSLGGLAFCQSINSLLVWTKTR